MKTDSVRVRVDAGLKKNVSHILGDLGMNMSEAVNALFIQIQFRKGLPFDMLIPNAATKQALKDTHARNTFRAKSVDALLNEIE